MNKKNFKNLWKIKIIKKILKNTILFNQVYLPGFWMCHVVCEKISLRAIYTNLKTRANFQNHSTNFKNPFIKNY